MKTDQTINIINRAKNTAQLYQFTRYKGGHDVPSIIKNKSAPTRIMGPLKHVQEPIELVQFSECKRYLDVDMMYIICSVKNMQLTQ